MKKISHLLLVHALFLSVAATSQTIYTANNNPGAVAGPTVFTGNDAINLAHTAASNGDIIYIVPSGILYNNVTVTKSLTFFGSGFNPDAQGGAVVTVNGFNIRTGSVRISGLVSIINSNALAATVMNNIVIDRVRASSISLAGQTIGNLTIQNCILGESTTHAISLNTNSSNVRIANNIIYAQCNSCYVQGLNNAIIENNVLLTIGGLQGLNIFGTVTNSEIKNNIFYGVRPKNGTGTFSGNEIHHNLCFDAAGDNSFPGAPNNSSDNISGQNAMFVNAPAVNVHSFAYDYHLQAGSPAIGTGESGTDMGIFGGANPFDVYGSPLPVVQSIVTPATLNQGTNMTIRVKAKGN